MFSSDKYEFTENGVTGSVVVVADKASNSAIGVRVLGGTHLSVVGIVTLCMYLMFANMQIELYQLILFLIIMCTKIYGFSHVNIGTQTKISLSW